MNLKGKCKEDFEKWFNKLFKENYTQTDLHTFYYFPLAMRYGVYVDFFDSMDMHLIISESNNVFSVYISGEFWTIYRNTRREAQIEGIKQANKIYNNLNNDNTRRIKTN